MFNSKNMNTVFLSYLSRMYEALTLLPGYGDSLGFAYRSTLTLPKEHQRQTAGLSHSL